MIKMWAWLILTAAWASCFTMSILEQWRGQTTAAPLWALAGIAALVGGQRA
jgi:hypothetical protein